MHARARWVALVAPLVVTACGGDDAVDASTFVGVYQVGSHTVAETPGAPVACAEPGTAVVGGAPYLALLVDPFFDDPSFLRLSECDDATVASCRETLTLFTPGPAGLVDESANSQLGGGFPCQLYYSKGTATLTGAALAIEIVDKYDGTDRPADQCTLEAAQALASSSQCRRVERYDAVRLP